VKRYKIFYQLITSSKTPWEHQIDCITLKLYNSTQQKSIFKESQNGCKR